MGIGFPKDVSDVTCWKGLGTRDALNAPEQEVLQEPKSGMSRRASRTRLLFQIIGFQKLSLRPTLFSLLQAVATSPTPVYPLDASKRFAALVVVSKRFSANINSIAQTKPFDYVLCLSNIIQAN